jgi:fibronectin type 3 domain-containing protein
MKRRISLLLLFFVSLLSPDCGKKGPLEPPLVRTLQTVKDFSLFQKGDKLILSWANPTAYVDGNPLREVSEVEIWMAEEDKDERGSGKKLTAEEFEEKARLLTRLYKSQFSSLLQKETEAQKLSYVYPLGAEKIGQKVMTFAVRIKDERRRASEFSEPVSIEVQASPLPPQNVRASVFEKYVEVSWEAASVKAGEPGPSKPVGYNVYRSEEKGLPARQNSSPVKGNEYRDVNFSLGKTYRYFIRSVASDKAPLRESDDSEIVEILAKDTFPPAPPTGLTAISGAGFIALSWEPDEEPDLAGYKVWRRTVGQAGFDLLKSVPATENSYSDSLVEKNKRYDYAITALDNAGNESQKSEIASGIIRDNPS